MRKKHWLIGLLGLTALVVGLGTATVAAQERRGEPSRLGLFARVADILGLEAQQVQDAFEQAQRELRQERFEEMESQRLDALVESGRMTQEQADELREWYAARPESFWLAGGMERGKSNRGDKGRMFGPRGYSKGTDGMNPAMIEQRFEQHLNALVQRGQITQEQADSMRDRFSEHAQRFTHRKGDGHGKGSRWHRSHGTSFHRGFFSFMDSSPMKDQASPATPEVPAEATPVGTPQNTPVPADSSESN